MFTAGAGGWSAGAPAGPSAQRPGKYCAACGQLIDAMAEICPKCGVRQHVGAPAYPPAGPHVYQSTVMVTSGKNKIVAAVLAFFLGMLGVHRFYLGDTGYGVAMLAITIVSFFLTFVVIGLFGLIAMGLWSFIDFVRYLVMDDMTFNARYNQPVAAIAPPGSRPPYA